MTWNLDTNEINASSELIISNLQEESLAVYCFINEQWKQGSVVENKLFQFVFRSFYRIDNAGLTDEFKQKYFELLESARSNRPDINGLCETLYNIENRKGYKSLQFSFVTKLANTVNPLLPIYDSEVAKMYGYRAPLSNKPLNERIDSLLKFHMHLAEDYKKILGDGTLEKILSYFDKQFPKYSSIISQSKKLDFVVWSAGKLSS